jgi:hypothetical protein
VYTNSLASGGAIETFARLKWCTETTFLSFCLLFKFYHRKVDSSPHLMLQL